MAAPRRGQVDVDDESGPERTCIVTRVRRSAESMIRFVLDPAGRVVPDIQRKLPGRGVWISNSAGHVNEAVRKGSFARSFKRPVVAAPDLAEVVEALLEKDALQSLSMANKAGVVAAGAFKVEEMIGTGAVAIMLHAAGASAVGRRKLAQKLTGAGSSLTPVWIEIFNSEQIGLALGRASVVHAALRNSPAAAAFAERCRRLAIYRGKDSSEGVEFPLENLQSVDPEGSERGQEPGIGNE